MTSVTPGPWPIREFDDCGGYDCMTAGISVGPAHLDGAMYGQKPGHALAPSAKQQMLADARLIAAAHQLARMSARFLQSTHRGRIVLDFEEVCALQEVLSHLSPPGYPAEGKSIQDVIELLPLGIRP